MMAQDGIARAVRPAHTPFDGDTIFALASGAVRARPRRRAPRTSAASVRRRRIAWPAPSPAPCITPERGLSVPGRVGLRRLGGIAVLIGGRSGTGATWGGSLQRRSVGILGLQPDRGDHAVGLLQHLARIVPMNGDGGIADRFLQKLGELIDVGLEALAFRIHRRMRFEQQLAVDPGDLDRLVDEPHRRAHRNQRKERRDIVRIHADAAMGHGSPTAIGLFVPWISRCRCRRPDASQSAERIVGTRRHARRQGIARFGVLLAHRFRRVPGGSFCLAMTCVRPERGAPIHLADADRDR